MKKGLFVLIFNFGVLLQLSSQAPTVAIKQYICNSDDTYNLVIEVYGAGDISTFAGYQVDAGVYEVSSCYDSSFDTGNPCYIVLPIPGPPPVCGCNGVEYEASGCAEIDGYPSWTEGPCTGNERVIFTIHNLPSAENTTINVFRLVKVDGEEFVGPSTHIQANHSCSQATCLTCHTKSNPLTFNVTQDTSVTIEHLMTEPTQGCSLSFDRTQNKMVIPFKCSFLKGQTSALDSFWVYDLVKGDSCLSYVRFMNGGYCCKPFTPCDDGNSCTYGDQYDNNCNCIGKIDTSNKEYSFTTTNGENILMDNIADSCNVYVFIFYFHWCKPCQTLYESHTPINYKVHNGLNVIPIMMEATDKDLEFLKDYSYDFIENNPFLNIVEGGETEFLADHCLNSAPTVFVKCPNKDTLLVISGTGDKQTMPEVVNNVINNNCKCAKANDVTISIPSKSANNLDTFSIPVTVTGFQNLLTFQFPITWDTTKLELIKIHSFNKKLNNFTNSNVATPTKGNLRCLYFEPNNRAFSLSNSDTLFSMQFKTLSHNCDSSFILVPPLVSSPNIFRIAIIDNNFNELTVTTTDSKIKLNQTLCNDCTHPDYAPLMALYNSTNGKDWINNTGWKEGAEGSSCDPCNFNGKPWYGISCTNGRITKLILSSNNLNGILPLEIGQLSFLSELRISNSNLIGSIPIEISNIISLEKLSLHQTKLTNEIPKEIGNLINLSELYLVENELSGQIPSEIGQLTNLKGLWLFNNKLSGNIPKELGNLKLLWRVDLQSNMISGSIPIELTSLNELTWLILRNNRITGPIPKELANLNKISAIALDNNNFSGCIPQELEVLCNIQTFDFSKNDLLPWGGDKTNFCNGESQIGAPCNDGNPSTSNDKIQEDCSCLGCIASTFLQSFSICKTESVTVGNNTYTLSGTYIDTLQSSTGCDSIITTNITQKPNTSLTQNIQICQGKTHTIGSNTYNLPGVYIDTLQSSTGCDSIITTTITQKPNTSLSQNIQICQGESISVGANTYISNGTYVDTLISRNGCDSIVSTILNVLQTPKIDNMIAICSGQSHQVGIKTYTQSGNYIDTLQSIFGCDSIISTFLTVRPSQNISFNAPDKICKGSYVNLSVISLGTFLWSDGQTTSNVSEILNANKTYQVTVTDQFGCAASSSVSITVVEPKIKAIPIADTLILCFKDTIINPYSLLAQFDANGTWTLDEKNISGQPFNLMELTEGIHTFNYGFSQQAPCSDMDTSFILLIKDCRIIDCSFTLIDDSIRVNKNEASEISLTINDILPDEYIITIISVEPDVLESTNLSDEGLYSFTVTGDFGDIIQVVYEICTPDCTDCKQASLWIDNEALKDIIRTNIILPNTSGQNATLRFTDEDILRDSELYIFNRNGDRIFHMKDYDNSWNADGYPGGIYFYVLRYRGVDIKKTLTVMK